MEKVLAAFTKAQLQMFRTFVETLELNGRSVDEALEYIDVATQVREVELPEMLKCPDCGGPLSLSEVNTTKANRVGGESRSQWHCVCGYDRFSKLTIIEEANKIRRLMKNGTR